MMMMMNDLSTNKNLKLANYYSGNIICSQILLLADELSATLTDSWLVSSSFQTGKKKVPELVKLYKLIYRSSVFLS